MQRIARSVALSLTVWALGAGAASAAGDPPTLTAPASGLVTNGPSLEVAFVLAQTAGGVPAVTLTPAAGAPRSFPFPAEAGAGQHTVTLDLAAEGIDDGTYGLTVVDDTLESTTATVVIDRVTQAPQLTSPAGGATISGALAVGYTLPEPALSGSVALVLTPTGGGTPQTLTLATAAAGAGSVTIDRAAPASTPGVASAVPASPIADGTYDVSLRYRDWLGNPVQSTTASAVVLRTPAEIPAPTRTPGMVGTVVAAVDRTPPAILGARIVRPAFKPAHPSRARFRLSESATVSFVLERLRRGSWVRVAASTRKAPAGAAFIRLPKGLRVARHRLTIRATDAAGNRSGTVRLSFRVR